MEENLNLPLSGISIIIVDDNLETVQLFSFILENEGAIVTTTDSVDDGLRKVRELKPDIIISNHLLTDGSGTELLAKIRGSDNAQVNSIPAISITGVTRLESITIENEMRAAGFSAFLAKPVEPEELVKTVVYLIKRKKAGSE